MSKGNPRDLPRGITQKTRTKNGKPVPVVTEDGTPVYRVRVWDAVLKKQIERTAEGLDAAKQLLEEFNEPSTAPAGSMPSASGSPTWRAGRPISRSPT